MSECNIPIHLSGSPHVEDQKVPPKMGENNVPNDLSGSPHVGGQKMSSSLKERLKRSSRLHSSPLSHTASPSPTHKSLSTYSPVATDFKVTISSEAEDEFTEYLRKDIESSSKRKLLDMYLELQQDISQRKEKLRKLKLVQQHHNQNKPDDLTSLIQKWLIAAQSSIKELYELLPEPKPPTMQNLTDYLHIDYTLVKFNPETDSFS